MKGLEGRMIFMVAMGLPLLGLLACGRPDNPGAAGLVETDRAFSKMSLDSGLNKAFIFYAADSVIKMREGQFPVTSKAEMAAIYRSRPDTGMVLKWYPVKAEVGASGDLGYTFGNWELTIGAKDTTMYGNYVSVWKRQPDGSWKYVLDSGVNTPKP